MKRSFTLIEVLIGFTLAAIILSVLFSSLYETSMVTSRLEKAEKDILSRAELQQRLDAVFGNLINPEQGRTPLYLTCEENENPILHLEYRCGIDPSPNFSNEVRGCLTLKKGEFQFEVTGNALSGKETPKPRVEILKGRVKKVDYEFLSHGEVSSFWEKEEKEAPAYLKLTFKTEDNKTEPYVFWINKEPEGVELK